MDVPKTPEELTSQIEQLVQGYIAQVRLAAQEAVLRAFARASVEASGDGAPSGGRPGKRLPAKTRSRGSASPRRRSDAELAKLRDDVENAIRRLPGASIGRLAEALGCSVRDLDTPIRHLKRAGRVRTVGEYHRMRYFPAAESEPSEV